jgi:hypothetical protein
MIDEHLIPSIAAGLLTVLYMGWSGVHLHKREVYEIPNIESPYQAYPHIVGCNSKCTIQQISD